MCCFWKFWRWKWIDLVFLVDIKFVCCLFLFDLIVLGVGCMFGVGVYVIVCEIVCDVVGFFMVILFFIVGIVLVLLGLCYVEFGVCVFKVGFVYVYSYVIVGELVVFIIGWNLVMEYMIGVVVIG